MAGRNYKLSKEERIKALVKKPCPKGKSRSKETGLCRKDPKPKTKSKTPKKTSKTPKKTSKAPKKASKTPKKASKTPKQTSKTLKQTSRTPKKVSNGNSKRKSVSKRLEDCLTENDQLKGKINRLETDRGMDTTFYPPARSPRSDSGSLPTPRSNRPSPDFGSPTGSLNYNPVPEILSPPRGRNATPEYVPPSIVDLVRERTPSSASSASSTPPLVRRRTPSFASSASSTPPLVRRRVSPVASTSSTPPLIRQGTSSASASPRETNKPPPINLRLSPSSSNSSRSNRSTPSRSSSQPAEELSGSRSRSRSNSASPLNNNLDDLWEEVWAYRDTLQGAERDAFEEEIARTRAEVGTQRIGNQLNKGKRAQRRGSFVDPDDDAAVAEAQRVLFDPNYVFADPLAAGPSRPPTPVATPKKRIAPTFIGVTGA